MALKAHLDRLAAGVAGVAPSACGYFDDQTMDAWRSAEIELCGIVEGFPLPVSVRPAWSTYGGGKASKMTENDKVMVEKNCIAFFHDCAYYGIDLELDLGTPEDATEPSAGEFLPQ